jgi:ABC-2 type transport system permease protein
VAWVFVRLKLRMLRNRLSTGGFLSGVGFIVIWLAALAGGLGGGLILGVISRASDELIGPFTVLAFALVGLAWLVVPVVIASLDDSLEPRTFELLPFTPSELATGPSRRGPRQPWHPGHRARSRLRVDAGIRTWATALPVVIVAATAVLLCVVGARWATTRLSDLLRQRRGQEVALLVVVGLSMLPALASVTLAESAEDGADITAALEALAGILQWTPWGALGRSVVAIGDGDWILAGGSFAYGATAPVRSVGPLGSLRCVGSRPSHPPTASPAAVPAPNCSPREFPLPASPVGAVAAKELIAVRRDVRVRSQILGGVVAIACSDWSVVRW